MVVPFPGDEILPIALAPPTPAIAPAGVGGLPPPVRIDLTKAPSGMELRAQRQSSESLARVAPPADGKIFCALCDARVPTWFGTDCIAGDCSLRACV